MIEDLLVELVFVENAPGFGGSLTGILHLIDAFPNWVRPTLICGFDPREMTPVPDRLRVEVVPIDVSRTNKRPGEKFASSLIRYARYNVWPWAREVERICKKYGATLIHANNLLLGNFGAAVAGWRLGIPVLSHQKGYETPSRLVRMIVERKWYRHHIATSHAIADHLLGLGIEPERCSMIYDAIVPPETELIRQPNPSPVVAMHSVLRESKGHRVFLEALSILKRRGAPEFQAVIAGAPPQPSDYPEELKRLASELGLSDHVKFLGHLRDPFELLRGVDISVHASTEPEPFGRVAAESMLMGASVIAAAGSGAGEYVEAAGAGYTTPPGDADALADALARLLESAPHRQELAAKGQAFARDEFAPKRIARQLIRLYEDVLRGQTPSETLASTARDLPEKPLASAAVGT